MPCPYTVTVSGHRRYVVAHIVYSMPCPYPVTVSCNRRYTVAHIVAAQSPTVTVVTSWRTSFAVQIPRPTPHQPSNHRMMIFPTFRFSRIR